LSPHSAEHGLARAANDGDSKNRFYKIETVFMPGFWWMLAMSVSCGAAVWALGDRSHEVTVIRCLRPSSARAVWNEVETHGPDRTMEAADLLVGCVILAVNDRVKGAGWYQPRLWQGIDGMSKVPKPNA
jgi:hypothetical protein